MRVARPLRFADERSLSERADRRRNPLPKLLAIEPDGQPRQQDPETRWFGDDLPCSGRNEIEDVVKRVRVDRYRRPAGDGGYVEHVFAPPLDSVDQTIRATARA